ncbi:hypothetical protein BH24DEI2_BH24DEI2_16340 [soil metagenome]
MRSVQHLLRLVLALVFLQTLFALAQDLVVNGRPVADLALLKGSSYAPADAFGAALGAETLYDDALQTVTFSLAGQLVSVQLGDGAGAVRSNGANTAEEGGVLEGGRFYVPVKPVTAALGGTVTWLPSQQTVLVVLPRAQLLELKRDKTAARGYERLVLDFAGLTPYDSYFNAALGTLQLRFERADATSAQTLSGEFFSTATATPNRGYLDFRVTAQPGYRVESYTTPRAGGFSVVVDLVPDTAAAAGPTSARALPLIVLDPGHGGADAGLRFGNDDEKDLTLQFAERVAAALASRDVEVRLTRRDDSGQPVQTRSQAGVGASLFVSVHAADLPAGRYNVYYLGDVDPTTPADAVVRANAADALSGPDTDALRRRILLKLVPDLALGERYARTLATDLGGAERLAAAPLAVLSGAAGRGVLLELSPTDLAAGTGADLAAALADALVAALRGEP